jgi:hypothetical protein
MINLLFKCSAGIVVIFGNLLIFWGLQTHYDEKNSQYWPSTTGTVIQTELIRNCCRGGVSYTPRWTYEYYINSKKYSSYRTTFGSTKAYPNKIKAQNVLSLHPVGSKVNLIYNPEKHNKAALQLSSSPSFIWLVIFTGGLIMLVGIFVLKIDSTRESENRYV